MLLRKTILFLGLFLLATATYAAELNAPLDRESIVARHHIVNAPLEQTLPIGNGNFCFNADGTGLQTFGGDTLAHWAWYSEPLPKGFEWKDVSLTGTYWKGKLTGADPWPADKAPLYNWLRQTPFKMNLARVRFLRPDGAEILPNEIVLLNRKLNIQTGLHSTAFVLDNEQVVVDSCVTDDVKLDSTVAIKIDSTLLSAGKLIVQIDFPYPSLRPGPWDGDFSENAPTTPFAVSRPARTDAALLVKRFLRNEYNEGKWGEYSYSTRIDAKGAQVEQVGTSSSIRVLPKESTIELSVAFDGGDYSRYPTDDSLVDADPIFFDEARAISQARWDAFWRSGAAIDLSGSADPRWMELERRVVLSQFQLRSNAAGNWPCGESGLITICPWSGRFHMEMVWWHLIHWWAWDRAELADDAVAVYSKVKEGAKALAEQLGYDGLKWQKEIAPDGRSAPWTGNLVLLWKQPHPIYFAEMDYRRAPTKETLDKWAEIVEGAAAHMADYATKDANGVYHLAPAMPPSEQGVTKDDVFDLSYWRWGFDVANKWRERIGKEREPLWDEIRQKLQPLPIEDGYYAHSPEKEWRNSFSGRNYEHPDLIGIYGMTPPNGSVDLDICEKTLERVLKEWRWDGCWGWDFPWMTMCAVRLGRPDLAIEAILYDTKRNYYDVAGVNLGGPSARGGLGPYLPGNGGLLMAIAGMCAGYDENASDSNLNDDMPRSGDSGPGFPEGWSVKWEGFKRPL